MNKENAGNALFILLIAVALFAGLSYAITQSSSGAGTSISADQAQLYASQIIQMSNQLKQDITRIIVLNTAPTSIKIGTGNWYTGQTNDFCTTGTTCLFSKTGYNVYMPKAPAGAMTDGVFHNFYFDTQSQNLGTARTPFWGVGTSANDEAVRLEPIPKSVCTAINRNFGINTIPYFVNGTTWSGIQGSIETACVDWGGNGASSNQYTFYQVLIVN